MKTKVLAIAVVGIAFASLFALSPRELPATKTVGHQARVERMRRIEGKPEPSESRVCGEHEISTDRSPCLGANGRLDYQPGR
jgi:hypothetical protein